MGDDHSRIDLAKLARLAEAGQLYQASDLVAATALAAANFVFWSGSSKGLATRLISARVCASAAMTAQFGTLVADPALAAGSQSVNLRLGGGSAQGFNEAAAGGAANQTAVLALTIIQPGNVIELISPGGIYLPPNTGVALSSALVPGTVTVIWLWAECPRE